MLKRICLILMILFAVLFSWFSFAFAQSPAIQYPPPPPEKPVLNLNHNFSQNQPRVLSASKIAVDSQDQEINYSPPSKISLTNWASYSVGSMIKKGVPQNTVILLLMLPIIVTIVVFIRQIVGFKTFGIYIPSLVTLVFLSTGIVPGLMVFLTILIFGTILRFILKRFRLLYLPRMSILLILVTLVIFVLLSVAAFQDYKSIAQMSIFPMLIMIILVEKFINVQIEKGFDQAAKLTLETLIISIVGYFILVWQPLKEFVLYHPGIIFIIILINILIGRWTGLRLVEYLRFREMLKNENKDQSA